MSWEERERLYFPTHEKLAILDAGAQYGKVIDRKVRGLGVETVILPIDTPAEELTKYKAFIISGGPDSVYSETAPKCDPRIFSLGKPILGICYGMQLMTQELGGLVQKGSRREDGPCKIKVFGNSLLFSGLISDQQVLMSHGDSVTKVAEGFQAIADSRGIVAAIENPQRNLYGVQFHPEVDLTPEGKNILANFLYQIAGFRGDFTSESREQKAIAEIKEVVGNRKVLALVSGGVDSTVLAALLNKALGPERVRAVHVDTGFMRENESQEVKEVLARIGLPLEVIDASKTFYQAIAGIADPERKRILIGSLFIQAVEELLNPEVILAQGTLRPDLIESASNLASGRAGKIKTHHNDSPRVRLLREKQAVIEPLKEYHKDEVRELGLALGLPEEIVWRQPFPGPGLAVRLLCREKSFPQEDFFEISEALQKFNSEEIEVTLLPIRTVGVQGDGRTYSYLVGLSGEANWEKLSALAREIPKTVHGVNRVIYLWGEKVEGPVTEITPTFVTRETISQLRQADAIVNRILGQYGLLRSLSQVPIISFPLGFGKPGFHSIALRPFITNDFMTGRPAIPGIDFPLEALGKIRAKIVTEVPGIARIAYDLTTKPPATTEWE